MSEHTGISNRQPPEVEEEQRHEFPPVEPESPPPQDTAGHVGEEPLTETPDRQTSHKAGVQSIAQKEEASKYSDRPMPQTRKVPGAFGKERGEPERND